MLHYSWGPGSHLEVGNIPCRCSTPFSSHASGSGALLLCLTAFHGRIHRPKPSQAEGAVKSGGVQPNLMTVPREAPELATVGVFTRTHAVDDRIPA